MKIKNIKHSLFLTGLAICSISHTAQPQPSIHETPSQEQAKPRRYPTLEEVLQKCALDTNTLTLFFAAKSGDLETITNAIQTGMSIDTRLPEEALTWCGATPLYVASIYGHNDIVKALLAAGANVNNRLGNEHQRGCKEFPRWGCSPLTGAVRENRIETVRILLQAGSDISETMGLESPVALHIAAMVDCSPELIQLLVQHGGQINNILTDLECRFKNVPCHGSTPLLVAIARTNRSVAKTLINLGADLEVECPPLSKEGDYEATPLFIAVSNGQVGIVQDLITANTNIQRKIQQGTLAGGTALHIAAKLGLTSIANLLINSGINLTQKTTRSKKTALDIALENNHTHIASLISKKRLVCMF